MTKNIKLIIEYAGTNYFGWQRQNNVVTVQEQLEKAISDLTKENITVIGCSRTDTGVHAREYTANFYTDTKIPIRKIKNALNHYLPQDIAVLDCEEVDKEFHSRYHCKGKTYSYTIMNRSDRIAIGRNYAYHFRKQLDVTKMQEAATYLIGTHDFASFRNLGSSTTTSVRTIYELKVLKEDDKIKIIASADGFLYNMVRIITGTLIDMGTGKRNPEDMKLILSALDRQKAGIAAPPEGLCLEKVYY